MKDKLEGIIKKSILKEKRLKKSIQVTLKRHAENHYQLKNEKSRRKEDKHAYEFISSIYSDDRYLIRKYWNFYKRLKRIYS